jgi:hypothetical protein
MGSINIELAQAEVEKWLNYKKVSPGKREKQKAQIDVLVDSFAEGSLVLNEDFSITHNLKFPIGENDSIKELKYKPRISQGEVHVYLQKFKNDDVDGRVLAFVLALTKQPQEFIKRLDTEDSTISQGIAIFFI